MNSCACGESDPKNFYRRQDGKRFKRCKKCQIAYQLELRRVNSETILELTEQGRADKLIRLIRAGNINRPKLIEILRQIEHQGDKNDH